MKEGQGAQKGTKSLRLKAVPAVIAACCALHFPSRALAWECIRVPAVLSSPGQFANKAPRNTKIFIAYRDSWFWGVKWPEGSTLREGEVELIGFELRKLGGEEWSFDAPGDVVFVDRTVAHFDSGEKVVEPNGMERFRRHGGMHYTELTPKKPLTKEKHYAITAQTSAGIAYVDQFVVEDIVDETPPRIGRTHGDKGFSATSMSGPSGWRGRLLVRNPWDDHTPALSLRYGVMDGPEGAPALQMAGFLNDRYRPGEAQELRLLFDNECNPSNFDLKKESLAGKYVVAFDMAGNQSEPVLVTTSGPFVPTPAKTAPPLYHLPGVGLIKRVPLVLTFLGLALAAALLSGGPFRRAMQSRREEKERRR